MQLMTKTLVRNLLSNAINVNEFEGWGQSNFEAHLLVSHVGLAPNLQEQTISINGWRLVQTHLSRLGCDGWAKTWRTRVLREIDLNGRKFYGLFGCNAQTDLVIKERLLTMPITTVAFGFSSAVWGFWRRFFSGFNMTVPVGRSIRSMTWHRNSRTVTVHDMRIVQDMSLSNH